VRTTESEVWEVSGVDLEAAGSAAVRELVISVIDSGLGVEPELRERVFHPFFTTKERGSGVGLAHAQKIVASHGGTLELDGRPGEGAIFRVRLPVEALRLPLGREDAT
jgi:signal transduction histidine kinase